MLMNLWTRTAFFCGNHKEPIPLISISHGEMAKQYELACPLHLPKSDVNEAGYEDPADACPTCLTFREAESVIDMLSERVSEDILGVADLTGDRFATKQKVNVRVKKYGFKRIELSVSKDVS